MFEALTDKLKKVFSHFSKNKVLTEASLTDAMRQVRMALLDADVNYSVASTFIQRVKEKAIGQELIKSVKPAQQFVKIVHDELVSLMGGEEALLNYRGNPSVFFLVGLQGSGKTTSSVKLASFLQKKEKKKVLLAACDLQRPAAMDQLAVLASQAGVEAFVQKEEKSPLQVAKLAEKKARQEGFDVLIVDTAGRLHIEDSLMQELQAMKKELDPSEIFFVASAQQGQDVLRSAEAFDQKVGITGSILTMLDGDARAGAAISIREVTKKPLKFEGTGERMNDFQLFHPKSMADRILGMGDIINLVRKAEEVVDEKEKEKLEKKLKKGSFSFEDYIQQMKKIKSMGSLSGLLKMIPGASDMVKDFSLPEEELKKNEAMIFSMTPEERQGRVELSFSRRKRIALGSGVKKERVDKMIKGFDQAKKMMKKFSKMGKIPDLQSFNPMGNTKWR